MSVGYVLTFIMCILLGLPLLLINIGIVISNNGYRCKKKMNKMPVLLAQK